MALYGLSVFLETPKELRRGRRRYIIMSFLLTAFSTLASSLDIAWFFNQVFGATSGAAAFRMMMRNDRRWERILSTSSFVVIIFLGGVMMVSRLYNALVRVLIGGTLHLRYIGAIFYMLGDAGS